jgi:tripartite-type tricarboxylate transporter receptor subunit TctC
VAKAPADGYTIVLGQTSNLAINPTLYAKLPYDPQKDLTPIGLVATRRWSWSPAQRRPSRQWPIGGRAKAKPGEVKLRLAGQRHGGAPDRRAVPEGGRHHLPARALQGRQPGLTDVISGNVQLYMSSVPSVLQQIRTASCAPCAVTSAKRVDDLPQTADVGEIGYKGFDAVTWFGFLAPAGTPKRSSRRLNAEFNKACSSPTCASAWATKAPTRWAARPSSSPS